MLAEAEVHPSKKKGREVLRYFDEGYVARVNVYRGTFPYPLLEGPAQAEDVGVEPPFAEAKDGHGLRRFGLRGLEKKVNAPRHF
jgi:hypothetical protein